MQLIDHYGRQASYLRLSVTDRCNFNCIYCREAVRQRYISQQELLDYNEMEKLIGITTALGIVKVRITGGEPFIRTGLIDFMGRLRQKYTDIALSVTTNGSLIGPYIQDLKKIGLSSINLSLDSFNPHTFKSLTKSDSLEIVLKNMEQAITYNLKLKINVVALKGITDIEIDKYLDTIKELPIDLRFIEFMPLGANTVWKSKLFLSASEILEAFQQRLPVIPIQNENNEARSMYAGPARMYQIPGARGRLGFISAMSNHFCSSCNRLRVTASGGLRTCLFSPKEYNLRELLRKKDIDDKKIAKVLKILCKSKPIGNDIIKNRKSLPIIDSSLVSIGG